MHLQHPQSGIASGGRHIATADGTRLFVRDWGHGPAVVFSHGWMLGGDIWEYQVTALLARGFRCIAVDRRGCGLSDQPATGYDFDTFADDLAAVIAQLDLGDITLVGHSMGCGEIVRYFARHGSGRVARTALIAPTTPCIARRPDNPQGQPPEFFEQMVAALIAAAPAQIRRPLRSLCQMLGVILPPILAPLPDPRPKKPPVERKPRPKREKPEKVRYVFGIRYPSVFPHPR